MRLNKVQQQQSGTKPQNSQAAQQPIEVNKKQSDQVQPPQIQIQNAQQSQIQNPSSQYYPQQQAQSPQFKQQIPQFQQEIQPKPYQKPLQKTNMNLQQEINGDQSTNKNAIIMNKKIENMERNTNLLNQPITKKPKQKMIFQQREKELADNLETRRDKMLKHGRKNYNPAAENLNEILDINKMDILDDLQAIENAQENNEFMVSFFSIESF